MTRSGASSAGKRPKAATPSPVVAGVPRGAGALAGLVSGFVAVCLATFFAAVFDVVSPLDAVGGEVIDRVPLGVKEWAISVFGSDDKVALRAGMVVIMAICAAALGVAARRRALVGIVGIAVFGVVGMLAALHRPAEPASAIWPPLLGSAIGAAVLAAIVVTGRRTIRERNTPHESRVPLGWDRRRFLATTGGATAVAAVLGASGRRTERDRVAEIRATAPDSLPAVTPRVDIPNGAQLYERTPFVTPADDFYRIDTALSFPRVRIDRWALSVTGMVERELRLTYAELLARPQVERVVTLACVSNEVGGPYISNGVWQGVLLAPLLEELGVQEGVEQVFSRSLDGWTCGFPIEAARDGRDAMIAVGLNGEPLPLEHGYPARLVVPGLYGYVSATKWLEHIELTTWDEASGYWIPRGWARDAPIKTESRIDVPRRGDIVVAGKQMIAGIAWAQQRGISKVEVRVDGGEWQEARLGTDVSEDTWRQWMLEWDAPSGRHVLEVRATDTTGEVQTSEQASVLPDGATGWHRVAVNVQ